MTLRRTGLLSAAILGLLSACGAQLDFGGPQPPTDEAARPGEEDSGTGTNPPFTPNEDAGVMASSQPRTWQWVNPTPPANDLNAAFALTKNEAWLVGTLGTVLHLRNGNVTPLSPARADSTYHAVWASASDDLWIAGDSANGAELAHWDGRTWSLGFRIPRNATVHALWGTSKTDVWASVTGAGLRNSQSGLWHWDGNHWEQSPVAYLRDHSTNNWPGLRGIWGSAGALWAVGDFGALLRHDGKEWTPAQKGAVDSAPFDRQKNYVGVWGASPNDVWAAFVKGDSESACVSTGHCNSIGFSHWDGVAWHVAHERHVNYLPHKRTGDQGVRLLGTSSSSIVALLGDDNYWHYDGTMWLPAPAPEAGTALYGAEGELHAIGLKGYLKTIVQGQPASEWPAVFDSEREDLKDVGTGRDGSVFACTSSGRVLRWAPTGWSAALSAPLPASRVEVIGADDVWAVGTVRAPGAEFHQDEMATHYDGRSWSAPVKLPIGIHGYSVADTWASGPNDIWAVGGGMAHFDGKEWKGVEGTFLYGSSDPSAVHGTGPNDVWFAGASELSHWDGVRMRKVELPPSIRVGALRTLRTRHLFVTGPNDVWMAGTHGAHFDGTAWSEIDGNGDVGQEAIWGSGPKDMWFLSGGSPGGMIRHWDGERFTESLRASTTLSAIAGDRTHVWAVGESGATLRLSPDPARVVP